VADLEEERAVEIDEDSTTRASRAVWRVMADGGLERVTVRAVAQEAGCTTGMIMHHFGSRRALVEHARRLLFERTSARADAAAARGGSPRDVLYAVLAESLTLDDVRAEEARVWIGFLAASVGDPGLRTIHADSNAHWQKRIRRLLTAAAPGATGPRLSEAALSLIALTDGLAALSVADQAAYSPRRQKRILDEAIATTLHSLISSAPSRGEVPA
jgi:TetR/AcrR family transcriptional regulator, transcriptional repressor of bet genes